MKRKSISNTRGSHKSFAFIVRFNGHQFANDQFGSFSRNQASQLRCRCHEHSVKSPFFLFRK